MTAATTPSERRRLGYRPALDGLRGIAVLLVIFWHAGILPRGGGHAGVTLFFVLSGYLITRLLVEEHDETGRVNLWAFYRRRFLRLYPALIALGLVVAGYYALTGRGRFVVEDVGGAWLYITNWLIIAGQNQGLLDHTWTLAIEEHFYLLWPAVLLLVVLRRPRFGTGLLIGYVATVIVAHALLWTPETHQLLHKGTPLRLDALLVGCLLAVHPQRFGRFAMVLASIGLALVTLSSDIPQMIRYAMTAAALCSVVLVSRAVTDSSGVLSWRPLVYVGRISYGVYLWHQPLFVIIGPVLIAAAWPTVARAAVLVPLALLTAATSYHFVEEPFLRRKRQGSVKPNDPGHVSEATPHGAQIRDDTGQ